MKHLYFSGRISHRAYPGMEDRSFWFVFVEITAAGCHLKNENVTVCLQVLLKLRSLRLIVIMRMTIFTFYPLLHHCSCKLVNWNGFLQSFWYNNHSQCIFRSKFQITRTCDRRRRHSISLFCRPQPHCFFCIWNVDIFTGTRLVLWKLHVNIM